MNGVMRRVVSSLPFGMDLTLITGWGRRKTSVKERFGGALGTRGIHHPKDSSPRLLQMRKRPNVGWMHSFEDMIGPWRNDGLLSLHPT